MQQIEMKWNGMNVYIWLWVVRARACERPFMDSRIRINLCVAATTTLALNSIAFSLSPLTKKQTNICCVNGIDRRDLTESNRLFSFDCGDDD